MLNNIQDDRKKRLILLAIHAGTAAAAVLSLFLMRLVRFSYPCAFRALTNMYCLTCGSTRAAYALIRFEIVKSISLNPLPLLFALFLSSVILFDVYCLAFNKNLRYRLLLPWIIVMSVAAVLSFIYHNFNF